MKIECMAALLFAPLPGDHQCPEADADRAAVAELAGLMEDPDTCMAWLQRQSKERFFRLLLRALAALHSMECANQEALANVRKELNNLIGFDLDQIRAQFIGDEATNRAMVVASHMAYRIAWMAAGQA